MIPVFTFNIEKISKFKQFSLFPYYQGYDMVEGRLRLIFNTLILATCYKTNPFKGL